MIQDVSDVSDDISFVEALAQAVRESGLRQAEIVERSNLRLVEEIEKAKKEEDWFKSAILEMMGPLRASTLSRALRGVDSVEYPAFYRIGLGIDLTPEMKKFRWLDGLRQLEEKRNHATTQPRIAIVKGGKKQPNEERDIPAWVNP